MTENPLDKVIEKICTASGKKPEEIKKLIEEKQTELSGLVSPEGAAYMVGRELGVSLLRENSREFKVKNLVDGLRSVDLLVKVSRVFETREFTTKAGKQGRVRSIILGDETGTVRMPLWNEEIDKFQDIQEGDVYKISRGFVKMDYQGNPELRLGRGEMVKAEGDVELAAPEAGQFSGGPAARKKVSELSEGMNAEIRAAIVQVFRRKKPFYEVCPECGARLQQNGEAWECKEHGKKEPAYNMVLSAVLDDGTGNIRAVFFRDMAEKVFGKTAKELREGFQKEMDVDAMYDQFPNMGKEFLFTGRVKKNELAEKPELVVNTVEDMDLKKECKSLLKG